MIVDRQSRGVKWGFEGVPCPIQAGGSAGSTEEDKGLRGKGLFDDQECRATRPPLSIGGNSDHKESMKTSF